MDNNHSLEEIPNPNSLSGEKSGGASTSNMSQESRTITGISLSSVLELLSREGRTCLFETSVPGGVSGLVYFFQGMVWNAVYGKQQGEEALFSLLSQKDVRINFLDLPPKKIKRLIYGNVMSLLLKWSIRSDEEKVTSGQNDDNAQPGGENEEESLSQDELPEESPVLDKQDLKEMFDQEQGSKTVSFHEDTGKELFVQPNEGFIQLHESVETEGNSGEMLDFFSLGEGKMGQIDEILGRFRDVEGFSAIGVFSPQGEMVSVVNNSGMKIDEIGALANDVLLKAQKATEIMGVGRGEVVHIEAPKAHVIARCMNESTDFSVSSQGRAHIHVVLVIGKEGNLAMGKMRLNAIMGDLAPLFR